MDRVSWLGRTFGWRGSPADWLALLLILLWCGGIALIGIKLPDWGVGPSLLALVGWCGVFAIVARGAIRDLFGPVFFYDLLRVSRSSLTFGLRIFYVISLGVFLFLMYFDWLYQQSGYSNVVGAQVSFYAACGLGLLTLGLFFATRGKLHVALRLLGFIGGSVIVIMLLGDAWKDYQRPSRGTTPENLPSSVVSKFATSFFEAFVVVQWIVLALLTPVYTAGTIAVEKERKTLEFLLATDLRNREIVFGKLAARVLLLVMFVLAGVPLMAFLQLFGGIDPEQLLAASTVTLVTVFGLAAVSVAISVALRKARDAIVITYLLIIAYGFVSILLAALTNLTPGTGWWNDPVPLLDLSLADGLAFFADGNPIWGFIKMERNVAMTTALRDFVLFWAIAMAGLLTFAITRLRHVTIQQAYGPARKPRTLFKRKDKSARTHPDVSGNPVTWKEVFVESTFRGGCLGKLVALIIFGLIFVPLGMIVYFEFIDPPNYRIGRSSSYAWYRFQQEINGWVRVVTGILGFLMMMAAAIRGAGAFSGEKDRDSWISLISTPLSSEEILWGKWWGCILSVRRAFLVLLVVWGIGLALGAVMPIMLLVMLPLTLIYVSAFSWVGLYCSMTARNTLVASVRGFFAGLFCAGGFWIVLGLCCFLPLNYTTRSSGRLDDQLISFWFGFQPPVVYGVFVLGDFDDRHNLGPFRLDSDYSAGLNGPIYGTIFWILFNVAAYGACVWKCRQIMNRGDSLPDRSDSSDSGEPRQSPA